MFALSFVNWLFFRLFSVSQMTLGYWKFCSKMPGKELWNTDWRMSCQSANQKKEQQQCPSGHVHIRYQPSFFLYSVTFYFRQNHITELETFLLHGHLQYAFTCVQFHRFPDCEFHSYIHCLECKIKKIIIHYINIPPRMPISITSVRL